MGGSAPKPDKRIGEAAMLSAQTGQDMLAWMKTQAETTNKWAEEDRSRYTGVFQPLQDQFISEAQTWDSADRKQARADQAVADVQTQAALAGQQQKRSAMAMGVDPTSGRYASAAAKTGMSTALASAGAANNARRMVETEAEAKRANAINMGSGLAVNPGTSMGLSNGAASTGFSGAMNGYGQQASLLNSQYQQQMQGYQAKQGAIGSVMGAGGMLAGAFLSSKKVKEDRQPFDSLDAVKKMPVEKWRYKDGYADGAEHVGPYAEDFAKATGVGDGKSIDPITAMGVTMGAVQQLAAKVDKLDRKMSGGKRPARAIPMGLGAAA